MGVRNPERNHGCYGDRRVLLVGYAICIDWFELFCSEQGVTVAYSRRAERPTVYVQAVIESISTAISLHFDRKLCDISRDTKSNVVADDVLEVVHIFGKKRVIENSGYAQPLSLGA